MKSTFAILPYITIPPKLELRIGQFVLWRNSGSEWVKRFGADNTLVLEMYRDERGDPVGERATILTRNDGEDASYEEFRDVVHCLSTAVWLRGSPASDAWVFERWHVDVPTPAGQMFHRSSRFSSNLTSANVDRVYPTPYTHRIALGYQDQDAFNWLGHELTKTAQNSLLAAFSHFHLARFDTPYFTSPEDAVEALWAGFESLLEIDRFGQNSPQPRKAGRLSHFLRLVCRSILPKQRNNKLSKSEKLVQALQAEFQTHQKALHPYYWDDISRWVKQFYLERNHHSHGVRSESPFKLIEPYGISAYEVGLHLARGVLELRWRGDNFQFAEAVIDGLNSLFLFRPLTTRVSKTLLRYDRKVWFPGSSGGLSKTNLKAFTQDLYSLTRLRTGSRQLIGDNAISSARQKMGLVLSAWVTDLVKSPPQGISLDRVKSVPGEITRLAQDKVNTEDIDTRIAIMLARNGAYLPNGFSSVDNHPRMMLLDTIPLWLWISVYIKLSEIWLGYPLDR